METASEIKEQILLLTKRYYELEHKPYGEYREGNRIPYAGRVFNEQELAAAVEASLEFWLTAGHFADTFERNLRDFLHTKYCSLTNSGSSANLLAFMALTSPLLGERRVKKGDEVITVAAGFPTTISPIIQYGAIPVFVDIDIPSYNINTELMENALSPKTRAVILAHTLGNPFNIEYVKSFCERHGLWLIEDNCDALGSEYFYGGSWRYTGTIGDIATSSFYPPHHITMGEGGAVYTNNALLMQIVESFRDWGRDCSCPPGKDNTCAKRFSQKFGELPIGYDHKYVYSHFGYNLKATDIQAAIGAAQLKKLPEFIKARRDNWNKLREIMSEFEDIFILPKAQENSNPSWFGFLLTLRENAKISRGKFVEHLEQNGIQTRNLFAGNFTKHPCFDDIRGSDNIYRVSGKLENTDAAMERSFWIGVYPGMTDEMIGYIGKVVKGFTKV
ncbi:MAG: lipopolysaccharide biosynthesis protein RfbH [Clostridiales bacterium]|jgi:CDP-6-deoxy-D-xylo-4-hexulose-3-dehydrase|nr:lipopolysaccharide biosynthesis protein RfbH [Clostridiales bacterium]